MKKLWRGSAPDIVKMPVKLGVVFTPDGQNRVDLRAFGGQTNRRTAYAGASTGKQIVSAMARKCREYEASGCVERRQGVLFLCGLIRDGVCYGALLYNMTTGAVYPQYADAVIMACGGQNTLFGKTTGSMLCDGSAVAALLAQGAALKNLEFIQYHPTTIETTQKRMLISEAARGEGGRLFYLSDADGVSISWRISTAKMATSCRGMWFPRKYMNSASNMPSWM